MPIVRMNVNVRLTESYVAWSDDMADETGTSRSDVIRAAMEVARRHQDEVRSLLKEVR